MEIIRGIEQGSEEWLAIRCGIVTASNFSKVMAKGGGKTRLSYMYQLAAEQLTGQPVETYSNAAMDWGNECEPQARSSYEFRENADVEQVTFIRGISDVGCSPDGLVGSAGMLEVKCPKTTTQIERYLKGDLPSTYKAQVQGQMWVAEREWCDFVSFDPRINGPSSYFKTRVERDDKYISELEIEVDNFLNDLNEILEKLGEKIEKS